MALPSLYGRMKNSFTEKYMSILTVDGQPKASLLLMLKVPVFVCSLLYFSFHFFFHLFFSLAYFFLLVTSLPFFQTSSLLLRFILNHLLGL